MKVVCRRFLDSGMTPDEAAEHMDVSVEFVEACLYEIIVRKKES